MSRTPNWIAWMLLALLGTTGPALAQEPAAFVPFDGHVIGDEVNVRAGPGKNYYIITKLKKDAPVHVEDNLYGWYKITPPKGAWSLISKAYVELNPDGKTGKVTADRVRVRAPNPEGADRSYRIQLKLDTGDTVQVIGSDEGYYRIAPPEAAHLFISEQYVAKGAAAAPPPNENVEWEKPPAEQPPAEQPPAEQPPAEQPPAEQPPTEQPPAEQPPAEQPPAEQPPAEKTPDDVVTVTVITADQVQWGDQTFTLDHLTEALQPVVQNEPDTQLIIQVPEDQDYQQVMKVLDAAKLAGIKKARIAKVDKLVVAQPPDQQPDQQPEAQPGQQPEKAPPTPRELAQKELLAIEQEYARMSARPLEEQSLDAMIGQYSTLLADDRLGRDGQALINTRLEILRTRRQLAQARRELAERKAHAEARAAQQQSPSYNAVGKLHASTLYTGDKLPLLYRLVDPLSGLTVAYVKPVEGMNLAGLSGRYVGIVGESAYDEGSRLRVVTPKRIDPLGVAPQAVPEPPDAKAKAAAEADRDAAAEDAPPAPDQPRWEDR